MDRYPKKPCKHCNMMGHFSYACYHNPKRVLKQLKRTELKRSTKPINRVGKQTKQWLITRATWIKKHPPAIDGKYWLCYLQIHPWCPVRLDIEHLTLDHVVSRSRDASLRFSQSNLQPACIYCNGEKGSRSLDQVKPKHVQ